MMDQKDIQCFTGSEHYKLVECDCRIKSRGPNITTYDKTCHSKMYRIGHYPGKFVQEVLTKLLSL